MAINATLKQILNGDGYASPLGSQAQTYLLGDIIDAMHTELGGDLAGTTLTADAITGDAITVAETVGDLSVGGAVTSSTTASTAVTGATETITNFSTGTFTIPANSLAVGDRIRIRAQGIHTATTGAETLVITVRAGSTALGASGSIDPVANDVFFVDFELHVVSIGASGTVVGAGQVVSGTRAGTTVVRHLLSTGSAGTSTTTLDTTGSLVLAVAITHQAAATDANSSRLDVFAVDYIPAP